MREAPWWMAVESKAVALTERLDALAAALRAAGVSAEQSASLLASAATAAMNALTLDALLDGPPPNAAGPSKPAVAPVDRVAARVSLAA